MRERSGVTHFVMRLSSFIVVSPLMLAAFLVGFVAS